MLNLFKKFQGFFTIMLKNFFIKFKFIEDKNPEKLLGIIERYVKEGILDTNISPSKTINENTSKVVSEFLYNKFQNLPNNLIDDVITSLTAIFAKQNRQDEGITNRVKLLKAELKKLGNSENRNWQDVLLKLNINIDQKEGLVTVQHMPNDDISKEIDSNKYSKLVASDRTIGFIGSNFSSDRKGQDLHEGKSLILDGFSSATHTDKNGNKILIGAIADGAGGHSDKYEDNIIGKVAKYSCEYAIRNIANKIELLKEGKISLNEILDLSAEQLRAKLPALNNGINANASMLSYFVYPLGNDKYKLVCASIGDCMLSMFDPNKKEFKTIAPAEKTKWGPALFPQDAKQHVRIFETEITSDSIILAMTDGIYDELKQAVRHEAIVKDNKDYTITSLDPKIMSEMLSNQDLPSMQASIQNNVMKNISNEINEGKKQGKWTVGDDMSLMMNRLPLTKNSNTNSIHVIMR